MDENYIVIIDQQPIAPDLLNYFKAFNINLVFLDKLSDLKLSFQKPNAFIVNWHSLVDKSQSLKTIHENYPIPLIVCLDKGDLSDPVDILNAGADDVMRKPLLPRELHARVNAIQRRFKVKPDERKKEKSIYFFSRWQLYPHSRQVFDHNNQELRLTSSEYALLLSFVEQPQEILSRDYLSEIIRQGDHSILDRKVDIQISRLRQKIDSSGKNSLIKTVRSTGYMFTADVHIGNISAKVG